MQERFEDAVELLIVGSMVTNFFNKQSDCLLPKTRNPATPISKRLPSCKQNFMSVFAKLIARESEKLGEPVEKVVELPRMRVPLLIIRYASGLSIDIQFPEENYHALRNTHLMRMYKACDNRFTLLFLWLRAVCDKLEVRNSKYGLLSSYHLLLLVIHFLSKIAELIRSENPFPEDFSWKSHNKMAVTEEGFILRKDWHKRGNKCSETFDFKSSILILRFLFVELDLLTNRL
ncbi:hypothetical protein L5515_005800 [Caenorhabditis briggsae]|uniref:Poly(A) RNA polymerase mitochondrial-like central palm domain-containing protein n=1 Tax=Caenorhabditis briggsae TaxID=6238 RepID=A0AAE9JK14_CAEBR|nr:hypothetical protein L5515_005800 [Caenorhabditis briggsae]